MPSLDDLDTLRAELARQTLRADRAEAEVRRTRPVLVAACRLRLARADAGTSHLMRQLEEACDDAMRGRARAEVCLPPLGRRELQALEMAYSVVVAETSSKACVEAARILDGMLSPWRSFAAADARQKPT